MATCKDCIHYKICRIAYRNGDDRVLENSPCANYKNKADLVEVKHGEWQRQKQGFYFVCSVCGRAAATKGNYCHSCGAKMDKENAQ